PRSFSLSADSSSPASQTLPSLGVSSPPSRFSSVLLPEPELPTMATRWPGYSSSCRPLSTLTDSGPCSQPCPRTRQQSTARPSADFTFITCSRVAWRLRRLGTGRAPGRVKGGEKAQDQRRHANLDHIGSHQPRRQVVDEIHIGVEKPVPDQPLQGGDPVAYIACRENPEQGADQGPDHTNDRSLHHKGRHNLPWGCAESTQDGDIPTLVGNHHDQRRDDIECRHRND